MAAELDHAQRRLLQVYEIGKLLITFESIEKSFDAALGITTETLPLRSAILIEQRDGASRMIVWPSDAETELIRAAKAHAEGAFRYLVGATADEPIDLEEQQGATRLPKPLTGEEETIDRKRFIVIPLVTSRRPFGALQLEGAASLTEDDLVFVNAIANQLALALDRRRAWNRDISRRETAESRMERYQALVDNLDRAFVWEADAATLDIVYVSAHVEKLLGYPRLEWLEDRSWKQHIHPDDWDTVRGAFDRALSGSNGERCEHRCIARDGSEIWFQTGLHLADAETDAPKLQGVSVDVSERIRLYEEAQQAIRMREQILGVVSHDLKNPLTTILMTTTVLERSNLDLDASKSVERIERASRRMLRLIEDLLDFASIQAGRFSINPRPNDPASMLGETVASLEGSAAEKKVRLSAEAAPDLPDVECDRDRILQVLANLVGNAIKVTKDGVVLLRAEARGNEIVFVVSDTGPGISEADLEHIFERYWRSDRVSYEGTGLGLAIAHRIVEAHGGRIWAESKQGEGATFFFTLPVSREPSKTSRESAHH